MIIKGLWLLRILIQPLVFLVWTVELEIETLFLDRTSRGFWKRLRLFPNKIATRSIFLILGGYHASRLQRLARTCQSTQDKTLKRILQSAKDTAFGRDHGFAAINNYSDYVKALPIQTYTEHKAYIDRQMNGEADSIVKGRPIQYATTSGTTGTPKYIAVTADASRQSHRNVSLIWLYYIARRNVGFLNDSLLTIVGSPVEGKTPDGTPFGSASGQLRGALPRFMRALYAVPDVIFQIENYESRYYFLALFSLKAQISFITSANPSTLVLLFETIQSNRESLITDIESGTLSKLFFLPGEVRTELLAGMKADPARAKELRDAIKISGWLDPAYYWPRLAAVGCWKGGNSPVFLERLRKILPDVVPVFDLGYLASEIRATVPVERLHHGGLPTLHRNFFEFVEVEQWQDPSRCVLRLHELMIGERYYVLITTDCGLYRYHINDIVRVVGYFGNTPELVFEQKGDGVTNLTGEKLYEQQVQLAMNAATHKEGISLSFYLCLLNKEKSRYEFLIEPSANSGLDSGRLQRLIRLIDYELSEVNMEYSAKRKSLRLQNPIIHLLVEGAFEQFRLKRVQSGVREAQFKMVLLSPKIELLDDFKVSESAVLLT